MTTDDYNRDFLRTLADAAIVEGVRLDPSEGKRVLDRFTDDFARMFGPSGLPECRCCNPDPATEERITRLRGPA